MLQQTEVQKSVYTAFRDSPFALQESVKEVYVKAGSSIQEIIDEAIQEEWQRKYLRVVLNDEVIKPEDYALTFVNEKDVVGMVLVPQDGDVGQIFKAIAIIAIVIAVTWALGPEGYAIVGPTAAAAFGATAGLAASLALNALFPPPVPGLPSIGGSSGTAEDPVYGFNKSGNSINKYGAIPRIYGCRKVFPQHAIAPYIIAEGSDQYLYQAFTAGYGPLKIEDIRIGDNAIGYYKDVEYYVHESFSAGNQLKIVKEDNWQDPYSIKLEYNSSNIISTTDDANKATLAIQFPQGLFVIDRTNGNKLNTKVYFQINIRSSGSSTWNPLTNYSPTITDGSLDSTVTSNQWNIVGTAYSGNTNYAAVSELPSSSSIANGEYRTLVTTTQGGYTDPETGTFVGDGQFITVNQDYQNSYTVATSTNTIVVEKMTSRPFFTNVNINFPSAGKWEIQIIRKNAYTNNGSWIDISTWTTADSAYTESYISSLRSIKNSPPVVPDKPISLIELKIKATDQLNGAVNNLSCIVTSKLPVWNGSSWSVQETRNPAWAYLDVMRGSAAKTPMSDSRIDLQTFLDWANWCDETQPNFAFTPPTTPDTSTNIGYVTNLYYTILFRVPDTDGLNYWVGKLNRAELTRAQVQEFFLQSQEASVINRAKCDLEVTSQTTAWEVLKLIAATGYATPSQNGGKYSVAIDKVKSTPVQIFTPKNIKSFSGNMSYYVKPHALRISYTRTNETDTDEIIVYDDGYNADGSGGKTQATIFEEMKLVGISRYNQAYTVGRRSLAQGQLRIETFTISCDVENLLATRGSLVKLNHDVPKIGAGSGKITNVSGSSITIDEEFKLTTGSIYATLRKADGSQSSHTLTSVSGSSATISGTGFVEGDLIVYGELNKVSLDCLVKSIRPGNDLTATLELVPYAPAIYNAETEQIPERDPFNDGWTGGNPNGGTDDRNKLTPGLIGSLLASYKVTYDNATPRITVNLSWTAPSTGGLAIKYFVWYKDTNGWRLLGDTTQLTYLAFNEYIFTDANGDLIDLNGKVMNFAVSGVGTDGSSLNPEYAKQVTVTPVVSAPKEIAALYATPQYIANEVSWTFTDDPFNTAWVEVWSNIVNDRATATMTAKVLAPLTSFAHSGLDPDHTYYYWVKAADGNGNYSEWKPNTNTSTVSAKPLTAVSQYIDISGFTGFRKSAGGAYTPTNSTLTAIVTGVTNPTYSWTVSGATTGATNASTVTVTPNNSDTKITVTLTVNGSDLISALTKTIIMPINLDGADGEAGGNGVMSAFPTIYQWTSNSTPPSRPSTTSTYTWGTGAFTAPSGWYTYAPNNTTAGSYLWSITIPLNTTATTSTSTLDWTNVSYPIRAIAYNGTNGTNGNNANLLTLSATSQAITFNGSGVADPASQTISFTANLQNLTGTATFTATAYDSSNVSLGTIVLGGSGNTRTLTNTQFISISNTDHVTVVASLSGYSDTITVVKLVDGTNAVSGYLTNEAVTLAATNAGVVSDFTPANGKFKVFYGTTDVSASTTFSLVSNTGCTAAITSTGVLSTTGAISVSAMSTNTDNATAIFQAVTSSTYGSVTLQKTLTLAKSFAGNVGQGQVKGICFLRATSAPATPTGGTYLSPTATGWSDGIPSGTNPLYMTTRIFTSDGLSPQQAAWTTPQLTSSLGQGTKVQFSINGSTLWHDTPAVEDVYMRTGTSTDGGITWTYSGAVKIKGEVGTPGTDGSNGSATFVITRSANDSSAPTNTEVLAAIGRLPVAGDIVTVSYNNYNNAVVYRYVTSWTLFTTYITGSLIVQNTITADRLVSKTISAASGVIDDAAVNTLQIAGNAVTVPSFFQYSGEVFNIGASYATIITGVATVTGLQPVVITFSSGIGGGSDNANLNGIAVDCNLAVYIETTGGSIVSYKEVNVGITIDPGLMRTVSGSCTFTAAQVPSGTYNFRVKSKCLQTPNGTTVKGLFARYPSFTLLETKR